MKHEITLNVYVDIFILMSCFMIQCIEVFLDDGYGLSEVTYVPDFQVLIHKQSICCKNTKKNIIKIITKELCCLNWSYSVGNHFNFLLIIPDTKRAYIWQQSLQRK